MVSVTSCPLSCATIRLLRMKPFVVVPGRGLGAVVACTEHLPRELGGDEPGPSVDAGPSDGAAAATRRPPTAGPTTRWAMNDAGDAGPDAVAPAPIPTGGPPAPSKFAPVTTLTAPVEVTENAGALVLEQGGRVLRVSPTDGRWSVMLDVPSIIVSGESGLLGMAFHPKFAQNGFGLLLRSFATQPPPAGFVFQSLLVPISLERSWDDARPSSAHPILTIDQYVPESQRRHDHVRQ